MTGKIPGPPTDGRDFDPRVPAEACGELELYEILDFVCLPMAVLEGAGQVVCYANPALCSLLGKEKGQITGHAFGEILEDSGECLSLLNRAYRTGKSESHTGVDEAKANPLCWSYEIWPVTSGTPGDDTPRRLIFQVTETTHFHRRLTAMNEALLVSAMRQHELVEITAALNAELQAEINERKRTQEALVRSELLANAGRMAASIAHEINNPLESVINTVFLARTSDDLPKAARELLEIADEELMSIAHITRQSLGFYREPSVPVSSPASALMAASIHQLRAKTKARRATVVSQCEEKLQVIGVLGELRQVVANLLANSLDAVEESGVVKLRCSMSQSRGTGRCVRITIADNGKGMSAATMKKIFEPFFTTKGTVGTGLGLWVCKELIDKNGGSIRVRSNTHGARRGTTFSVVLMRGDVPPDESDEDRTPGTE